MIGMCHQNKKSTRDTLLSHFYKPVYTAYMYGTGSLQCLHACLFGPHLACNFVKKNILNVCVKIYSDINNGVYKSGFSTSQTAYDEAQVQAEVARLMWCHCLSKTTRFFLSSAMISHSTLVVTLGLSLVLITHVVMLLISSNA